VIPTIRPGLTGATTKSYWWREAVQRRLLAVADVTAMTVALLAVLSPFGINRGAVLALAEIPFVLIFLSIFRRPELSLGLTVGLISYLVLFGMLFVVPYYLSAGHVDAARAGAELAVLPIAIALAAPVAGRLLDRVGHRRLTAGGMVLTSIGLFEIALCQGTPGLLAGLALAGLGLGAFTPANNATIMSAAPAGHTGVVSGVLNMTRGMGTALGVALASALYLAAAGASNTANSVHGLTAALVVLASLAVAASLTILLERPHRNRKREPAPTTCPTR